MNSNNYIDYKKIDNVDDDACIKTAMIAWLLYLDEKKYKIIFLQNEDLVFPSNNSLLLKKSTSKHQLHCDPSTSIA